MWTGAENLASPGIPFPDRPARNEWLYGLSQPDSRWIKCRDGNEERNGLRYERVVQ